MHAFSYIVSIKYHNNEITFTPRVVISKYYAKVSHGNDSLSNDVYINIIIIIIIISAAYYHGRIGAFSAYKSCYLNARNDIMCIKFPRKRPVTSCENNDIYKCISVCLLYTNIAQLCIYYEFYIITNL